MYAKGDGSLGFLIDQSFKGIHTSYGYPFYHVSIAYNFISRPLISIKLACLLVIKPSTATFTSNFTNPSHQQQSTNNHPLLIMSISDVKTLFLTQSHLLD